MLPKDFLVWLVFCEIGPCSGLMESFCKLGCAKDVGHAFDVVGIVTRPISMRAPERPRISRRGCPKINFMVANGCSTVHLRILITAGVILSCIRFKASSYRWRARLRFEACVQRDFR
jgi:hypothetical protein